MVLKLKTREVGLEESIGRTVNRVNRQGISIKLRASDYTQPLGRITQKADEFTKSLEASNARVIAFGASAAIIGGVTQTFVQLVTQAVKVEKILTDINVVLGTSTQNLEKFGRDLFEVAKNTSQALEVAAEAALEFSRQGLSMEEILRRTNDALILTRLTGIDAASAVSGLTAAINGFADAGLSTTDIINKLAAVDVAFAVSAEDLIDALARAGAVAQDAKVDFDQLVGAVTSAQQITARGGAVIGNSFKTIFTRIQRSSTINRLEELGVAVRDLAGGTLPALTVLSNLSEAYDTLGDATKAAVAEQVGGVFQINILKAALKDLNRENSLYAKATDISSQATNEAQLKNEQLQQTLSSLSKQTALTVQELAASIGELALTPGLSKLLDSLNQFGEGLNNLLGDDAEGSGAEFAKAFVRGIGSVITGPGVVLAFGVFAKLFASAFKFARDSLKDVLKITTAKDKERKIQESILTAMSNNRDLYRQLNKYSGDKLKQENLILDAVIKQTQQMLEQERIARSVAPGLRKKGVQSDLTLSKDNPLLSSSGFIPNYSSVTPMEREKERGGAMKAGYSPGAVKDMSIKGVGRVVYNDRETVKKFPGMSQPAIMPPRDSKAGSQYKISFSNQHGFDPYQYSGFIPNFVDRSKIEKLVKEGATPGERAAAKNKLNQLDSKVVDFKLNKESERRFIEIYLSQKTGDGSLYLDRLKKIDNYSDTQLEELKKLREHYHRNGKGSVSLSGQAVNANKGFIPNFANQASIIPGTNILKLPQTKMEVETSVADFRGNKKTGLHNMEAPVSAVAGKVDYLKDELSMLEQLGVDVLNRDILFSNYDPVKSTRKENKLTAKGKTDTFKSKKLPGRGRLPNKVEYGEFYEDELYNQSLQGLGYSKTAPQAKVDFIGPGLNPVEGKYSKFEQANLIAKSIRLYHDKSISNFLRQKGQIAFGQSLQKKNFEDSMTMARQAGLDPDSMNLKDQVKLIKDFNLFDGFIPNFKRGADRTISWGDSYDKYKSLDFTGGREEAMDAYSTTSTTFSGIALERKSESNARNFFSNKPADLADNWAAETKDIASVEQKRRRIIEQFNRARAHEKMKKTNWPELYKRLGDEEFESQTEMAEAYGIKPTNFKSTLDRAKNQDSTGQLTGYQAWSILEGSIEAGKGLDRIEQQWKESANRSSKVVESSSAGRLFEQIIVEDSAGGSYAHGPGRIDIPSASFKEKPKFGIDGNYTRGDPIFQGFGIYKTGHPNFPDKIKGFMDKGEGGAPGGLGLKEEIIADLKAQINASKIKNQFIDPKTKGPKKGRKAKGSTQLKDINLDITDMIGDYTEHQEGLQQIEGGEIIISRGKIDTKGFQFNIKDLTKDQNFIDAYNNSTITLSGAYNYNQDFLKLPQDSVEKRLRSPNEDVKNRARVVFDQGVSLGYYKSQTTANDGFIPNFADPLKEAIGREAAAGIPKSMMRVESDRSLVSKSNPMGLAVTNRRDEPGGVKQGINRAKRMGIDPKKHGASKGLIPNFADKEKDKNNDKITKLNKQEEFNQSENFSAGFIPNFILKNFRSNLTNFAANTKDKISNLVSQGESEFKKLWNSYKGEEKLKHLVDLGFGNAEAQKLAKMNPKLIWRNIKNESEALENNRINKGINNIIKNAESGKPSLFDNPGDLELQNIKNEYENMFEKKYPIMSGGFVPNFVISGPGPALKQGIQERLQDPETQIRRALYKFNAKNHTSLKNRGLDIIPITPRTADKIQRFISGEYFKPPSVSNNTKIKAIESLKRRGRSYDFNAQTKSLDDIDELTRKKNHIQSASTDAMRHDDFINLDHGDPSQWNDPFLASSSNAMFGGLIPNFSRYGSYGKYGMPKQVLKFDTGPDDSYGRSYVGKTLKSNKLFLTQNGYPFFVQYMKKNNKPFVGMKRANVGGREGYWVNQYEKDVETWAKMPNQERLDAEAKRKESFNKVESPWKKIQEGYPINFSDGSSIRIDHHHIKDITSKMGDKYRYSEINFDAIKKYAEEKDIRRPSIGGTAPQLDLVKAMTGLLSLSAAELKNRNALQTRPRTDYEQRALAEQTKHHQVKFGHVKDSKGRPVLDKEGNKQWFIDANPDAINKFKKYLKENGVSNSEINSLDSALKTRQSLNKESSDRYSRAMKQMGRKNHKERAGLAYDRESKETNQIPAKGIRIRNLRALMQDYNENYASKGFIPNYVKTDLYRGRRVEVGPMGGKAKSLNQKDTTPDFNINKFPGLAEAITPEDVVSVLQQFTIRHAQGDLSGRRDLSDASLGNDVSGAVSYTTEKRKAQGFADQKRSGKDNRQGQVISTTVDNKNIWSKKKLLKFLRLGSQTQKDKSGKSFTVYPKVEELKKAAMSGDLQKWAKSAGGIFINVGGRYNDRDLLNLGYIDEGGRHRHRLGQNQHSIITPLDESSRNVERLKTRHEAEIYQLASRGFVPSFASQNFVKHAAANQGIRRDQNVFDSMNNRAAKQVTSKNFKEPVTRKEKELMEKLEKQGLSEEEIIERMLLEQDEKGRAPKVKSQNFKDSPKQLDHKKAGVNSYTGFVPNFASQNFVKHAAANQEIRRDQNVFDSMNNRAAKQVTSKNFKEPDTKKEKELRTKLEKQGLSEEEIVEQMLLEQDEKGRAPKVKSKNFKDSPKQLDEKQAGVNSFRGIIPNFAENAVTESIAREQAAGIPNSLIRLDQDNSLKSQDNPMGLAITNTRDEPGGIKQGIKRAKEMNMDPKTHGANTGFVPNFIGQRGPVKSKNSNISTVSESLSGIAKPIQDATKSISTAIIDLTSVIKSRSKNLSQSSMDGKKSGGSAISSADPGQSGHVAHVAGSSGDNNRNDDGGESGQSGGMGMGGLMALTTVTYALEGAFASLEGQSGKFLKGINAATQSASQFALVSSSIRELTSNKKGGFGKIIGMLGPVGAGLAAIIPVANYLRDSFGILLTDSEKMQKSFEAAGKKAEVLSGALESAQSVQKAQEQLTKAQNAADSGTLQGQMKQLKAQSSLIREQAALSKQSGELSKVLNLSGSEIALMTSGTADGLRKLQKASLDAQKSLAQIANFQDFQKGAGSEGFLGFGAEDKDPIARQLAVLQSAQQLAISGDTSDASASIKRLQELLDRATVGKTFDKGQVLAARQAASTAALASRQRGESTLSRSERDQLNQQFGGALYAKQQPDGSFKQVDSLKNVSAKVAADDKIIPEIKALAKEMSQSKDAAAQGKAFLKSLALKLKDVQQDVDERKEQAEKTADLAAIEANLMASITRMTAVRLREQKEARELTQAMRSHYDKESELNNEKAKILGQTNQYALDRMATEKKIMDQARAFEDKEAKIYQDYENAVIKALQDTVNNTKDPVINQTAEAGLFDPSKGLTDKGASAFSQGGAVGSSVGQKIEQLSEENGAVTSKMVIGAIMATLEEEYTEQQKIAYMETQIAQNNLKLRAGAKDAFKRQLDELIETRDNDISHNKDLSNESARNVDLLKNITKLRTGEKGAIAKALKEAKANEKQNAKSTIEEKENKNNLKDLDIFLLKQRGEALNTEEGTVEVLREQKNIKIEELEKEAQRLDALGKLVGNEELLASLAEEEIKLKMRAMGIARTQRAADIRAKEKTGYYDNQAVDDVDNARMDLREKTNQRLARENSRYNPQGGDYYGNMARMKVDSRGEDQKENMNQLVAERNVYSGRGNSLKTAELEVEIAKARKLSNEELGKENLFRDTLRERIAESNLQLERMGETLANVSYDAVKDGFVQMVKDLGDVSKSSSEAFLNFAGSIVQKINDKLTEAAAAKLTNAIMGLMPGMSTSNNYQGGLITGYASGGSVGGLQQFSSGGYANQSNKVPAMLTAGEYVVRKKIVDRLGAGTFDKVNESGSLEELYEKPNFDVTDIVSEGAGGLPSLVQPAGKQVIQNNLLKPNNDSSNSDGRKESVHQDTIPGSMNQDQSNKTIESNPELSSLPGLMKSLNSKLSKFPASISNDSRNQNANKMDSIINPTSPEVLKKSLFNNSNTNNYYNKGGEVASQPIAHMNVGGWMQKNEQKLVSGAEGAGYLAGSGYYNYRKAKKNRKYEGPVAPENPNAKQLNATASLNVDPTSRKMSARYRRNDEYSKQYGQYLLDKYQYDVDQKNQKVRQKAQMIGGIATSLAGGFFMNQAADMINNAKFAWKGRSVVKDFMGSSDKKAYVQGEGRNPFAIQEAEQNFRNSGINPHDYGELSAYNPSLTKAANWFQNLNKSKDDRISMSQTEQYYNQRLKGDAAAARKQNSIQQAQTLESMSSSGGRGGNYYLPMVENRKSLQQHQSAKTSSKMSIEDLLFTSRQGKFGGENDFSLDKSSPSSNSFSSIVSGNPMQQMMSCPGGQCPMMNEGGVVNSVRNFYAGGSVVPASAPSVKPQMFSGGGKVYGPAGIDKVGPILLDRGEYVVKASTVSNVEKQYPGFFDRLNSMKMNQGGPVVDSKSPASVVNNEGDVSNSTSSSNVTININVSGSEASMSGGEAGQQDFARKVKDAVVGVIAQEKRSGGMLA